MGRIKDALMQLNELDDRKLKYKLHLPNLEYEDELDDEGNPIIDKETGRNKQVRIPSGFIYVITMYDPEDDTPKKYLCKIGYSKDVTIRLGQFNATADNPASLDWFARIPLYYGQYDVEKDSFEPVKGKTDQLDKKIHNVIDNVVSAADNYMRRRYNSQQSIDIRRLNVNGHNKEWYRMQPQEAVNIITSIINTDPITSYGEVKYNTKHPLYTLTHDETEYDDGKTIVKHVKNVGERNRGWHFGKATSGNGFTVVSIKFNSMNLTYNDKGIWRVSMNISNSRFDNFKLKYPDSTVKENTSWHNFILKRQEIESEFEDLPVEALDYLESVGSRHKSTDADKIIEKGNQIIEQSGISRS